MSRSFRVVPSIPTEMQLRRASSFVASPYTAGCVYRVMVDAYDPPVVLTQGEIAVKAQLLSNTGAPELPPEVIASLSNFGDESRRGGPQATLELGNVIVNIRRWVADLIDDYRFERSRLQHALAYTAFALHGTELHGLAPGITLIDGNEVRVKIEDWEVSATFPPDPERAPEEVEESLGAWLSAALDDPASCAEFKKDIRDWMALRQKKEATCTKT